MKKKVLLIDDVQANFLHPFKNAIEMACVDFINTTLGDSAIIFISQKGLCEEFTDFLLKTNPQLSPILSLALRGKFSPTEVVTFTVNFLQKELDSEMKKQ